MVWFMTYDIIITVVAVLTAAIIGGLLAMYGSKSAIQHQLQEQRKNEQQNYIRNQLMVYDKLWRFLKTSNTRWLSQPASRRVKGVTHWFTSDSYQWLYNHFIQSGNLLSLETFNLYLELSGKDPYDMTTKSTGNPANYMKLQEEAEQMCAKLRKILDKSE